MEIRNRLYLILAPREPLTLEFAASVLQLEFNRSTHIPATEFQGTCLTNDLLGPDALVHFLPDKLKVIPRHLWPDISYLDCGDTRPHLVAWNITGYDTASRNY
jgi:hypothetical protein